MKGLLTDRVKNALNPCTLVTDDPSMTMSVLSALLRVDPREAAAAQDDQQFAAFVLHPDPHRGVASRKIRYLLSFRSVVNLFLTSTALVGSPSDLMKVVAAVRIWLQIRQGMSVTLDTIGSLVVWAIWAHGRANSKILLLDVIQIVNTEAGRMGFEEVTREQVWKALQNLKNMKCVGFDGKRWFLRDRVELVI